MNRPSHYETKGKQDFLFGNATMPQVIAITVLFLLNMTLILLADCFLIHPIPADPLWEDHIPGEILSTAEIYQGQLILYRTPEGDIKAAKATRNSFHRYRLQKESAEVPEDPYAYDSAFLDFTIENGQITKASSLSLMGRKTEISLLIGLGFLLTALERMLFQKLRGE